jgi:hypothetical protein
VRSVGRRRAVGVSQSAFANTLRLCARAFFPARRRRRSDPSRAASSLLRQGLHPSVAAQSPVIVTRSRAVFLGAYSAAPEIHVTPLRGCTPRAAATAADRDRRRGHPCGVRPSRDYAGTGAMRPWTHTAGIAAFPAGPLRRPASSASGRLPPARIPRLRGRGPAACALAASARRGAGRLRRRAASVALRIPPALSVGGPLRVFLAPGLPPPTPPRLRHGGCMFRSPSPTAPDRSAVAAIPAVCAIPRLRGHGREAPLDAHRRHRRFPRRPSPTSGLFPRQASAASAHPATTRARADGHARSRQTLDAGPDAVTGARAPPRSTASRRAVADSLPPFGWGAAPRLFHPALPPALPHHRRLRPLALPVRNIPPNSAHGVSPCGLPRHRRITVRLWVPCATTRKVPVYGTISQVMQRWHSTPRAAW